MRNEPVNPTAGSILGFLATFGAMTGWDLEKMVDASIGNFWNVTRSQVYRELRDLAGRGLVVGGQPGPRDRTPFEITYAGRQALREWLARDPGPDVIRHRLLLTVFFSDQLEPGRLSEILAAQRDEHVEALRRYREIHANLEAASAMAATAAFGVRYEEMVVAWIDSLVATPSTSG
jgi:DNA-binding PadR family transcriptional regulator